MRCMKSYWNLIFLKLGFERQRYTKAALGAALMATVGCSFIAQGRLSGRAPKGLEQVGRSLCEMGMLKIDNLTYIFVFCFSQKTYVINDPPMIMMKKHPETSKFWSSRLPFSSCRPDNQHFDFQVRLGMGIALLGALNARRLACNLCWSPPVNPPIC